MLPRSHDSIDPSTPPLNAYPMHTTFEERLALLVECEITERKNLESIAALVREAEDRSALRVFPKLLFRLVREPVERAPHVLRLVAHEDAHAAWDNDRFRTTASSRRRVSS